MPSAQRVRPCTSYCKYVEISSKENNVARYKNYQCADAEVTRKMGRVTVYRAVYSLSHTHTHK
jgi:hypothetical protein